MRKTETNAAVATPVTAQTEQAINLVNAGFEKIAARSREAMAQGLKAVGTVTEMSRGNVDALLESSRAASTGLQALVQDVADYSKQSVERTAAAARALSQGRTANELAQLQSEFARTEFTSAIAEMSRLSQSMFQTMVAVFEPLQKQARAAAQIRDLLADQ